MKYTVQLERFCLTDSTNNIQIRCLPFESLDKLFNLTISTHFKKLFPLILMTIKPYFIINIWQMFIFFCNWLEFMNGTHVIPPKVYGKIEIFGLKIFLKRLWNRLDWVGLDRLQIFLDSMYFFSYSFSYLFSYYSFQKMWSTRLTPQKSLKFIFLEFRWFPIFSLMNKILFVHFLILLMPYTCFCSDEILCGFRFDTFSPKSRFNQFRLLSNEFCIWQVLMFQIFIIYLRMFCFNFRMIFCFMLPIFLASYALNDWASQKCL